MIKIENPYSQIFSLVDEPVDDFPSLVDKYQIDVAKDLKYSDLSNVHFGRLQAEVLDLQGCNLFGANLSEVRCRSINTDGAFIEGARFPADQIDPKISIEPVKRELVDLLRRAALAIYRYDDREMFLEKIYRGISRTMEPSVICYSTLSDQNNLMQRVIQHVNKEIAQSQKLDFIDTGVGREDIFDLGYRQKIILFFAPRSPLEKMPMYPADLDREFFLSVKKSAEHLPKLLKDSRYRQFEHLDQLAPSGFASALAEKRRALDKLTKKGVNYDDVAELRHQFIERLTIEFSHSEQIVLFVSGAFPISREFYLLLNNLHGKRLKLIFLSPFAIESQFYRKYNLTHDIMPFREFNNRKLTTVEDLEKIQSRISLATNGRATMAETTFAELLGQRYDLDETKQVLGAKIMKIAKSSLDRSMILI